MEFLNKFGGFCRLLCSTPMQLSSKEEELMTCILVLHVDFTKRGWARSVIKLLKNCKGVRQLHMEESGKMEVKCVANGDKLLWKIGRSRCLKLIWFESKQCSSNLFFKDETPKNSVPITSITNQPPFHTNPATQEDQLHTENKHGGRAARA